MRAAPWPLQAPLLGPPRPSGLPVCYPLLCHAVLSHFMLCHVMLCGVMLCCTDSCCVMLSCCAELYHAESCYAVLCYVMLSHIMLCCVMLSHIMLCSVVPCCDVLCHVMPQFLASLGLISVHAHTILHISRVSLPSFFCLLGSCDVCLRVDVYFNTQHDDSYFYYPITK